MSLTEQVINLLKEEATYKDILESLNLKKYELLQIYYNIINNPKYKIPWDLEFKVRTDYLKKVNFKIFKDEIILFVSDTHFGSLGENIAYLEQLKEIVKKNHITTIIHGGDIGDGMDSYKKEYNNYEKQIEHIENIYPVFPNTTQYIIAGNHDKKYKDRGIDILKILENKDKSLIGVGYYQAYFRINDKIISLEYNSKMNSKNILIQPDYRILGHGHVYKSSQSKTYLPTLSDNMTDPNININKPGFVILKAQRERTQENLIFDRYEINKSGYVKTKTNSYKI